MRRILVLARFSQFFSNPDARGAVELQQFRCRPPDWRSTDDAYTFEAKVNRASVASRVEKRYDLACVGIHGGDVRAFAPVAVEAGQRKVFHGRRSTVLCCDHMIRLVCHDESFGKQAVFAMVSGSVADLIAKSV
jgi:hypothetical protein